MRLFARSNSQTQNGRKVDKGAPNNPVQAMLEGRRKSPFKIEKPSFGNSPLAQRSSPRSLDKSKDLSETTLTYRNA